MSEGCPLQTPNPGYCTACVQRNTCVLLQILNKLKALEEAIKRLH